MVSELDLDATGRVLREWYAPALKAQMGSPHFMEAMAAERAAQFAALPRHRRAVILARRRLRASLVGRAARRVLDAWGVLLHGLPEYDW